jgi:hypothetical protein
MNHLTNILYAAAATFTLMAGANAPAQAEKPLFTFNDIEYERDGSDAADVGKTVIARDIPTGMAALQATKLLHEAGARCEGGTAAVRCTHNSFEAVDDLLQDVVWTVDMGTANGFVTSAIARRASIGS